MDTGMNDNIFANILKLKSRDIEAIGKNQKKIVDDGYAWFTADDAKNTDKPLSRIFRLFCLMKKVSKVFFMAKYIEQLEQIGNFPRESNQKVNNLVLALEKDSVTVGCLGKALEVLDYTVIEVSYTIKHKHTGEVLHISTSDIDKL